MPRLSWFVQLVRMIEFKYGAALVVLCQSAVAAPGDHQATPWPGRAAGRHGYLLDARIL